MSPDLLPSSCIALLDEDPPAKRRNPESGSLVWTFGQLGPDRDLRHLGLLATQPGMFAENLPEHLGIPVAQSEDGDLLMVVENGREHGVLRVGADDLEWLPGTIADWISASTDADPPPPPAVERRSELVGRWHPVSCENMAPDVFACMPVRELQADGTQLDHWTRPIEMTFESRWWCADRDRLVVEDEDGTRLVWHVVVVAPDTLDWTGPEPDRQVVRYTRSTGD